MLLKQRMPGAAALMLAAASTIIMATSGAQHAPPIHGSGLTSLAQPRSHQAVQCASVFASEPAFAQGASPLRNFCAPGSAGVACAACSATQASGSPPAHLGACDAATTQAWYQDALYWAASRHANGTRIPGVPQRATAVAIGPGVVLVNESLPCWQPAGVSTGVHVPSSVSLFGLCRAEPGVGGAAAEDESVFMAGPGAGSSSNRLWSLMLLAEARMGWPMPTPGVPAFPAAVNSSVHHIVLSGAFSGDNAGWRACTAAGALAGSPPSVVPPALLRVARGVFVPHAAGGVSVGPHLTVLHTFGNGVETGMFDQWSPQDPADLHNAACSDGRAFCAGLVYGFNGSSARPNTVTANVICDSRFGGVTVIGHNVLVQGNAIAVSEKTWTSPKQQSGTTMGVSAAFVGSSSVRVVDNNITGGDYAVGSDGSFPLYVTVDMFKHFWATIYSRMSAAFRAEYSPNGPPLDSHGNLAFKNVQDFVNAQQVLLDLSVAAHVNSTDPAVFDAGFGHDIVVAGNHLQDSVVGVSLYRQRRFTVAGNTVLSTKANTLGMWGVLLDHSHNTTASSNFLSGWSTGVMVRGIPGTLSRLGGSFSTVGGWASPRLDADRSGGNTIVNCSTCVRFWGAGWDNAVRDNDCTGWSPSGVACDYSGAQRLRPGVDWTTGNTPAQCNDDYEVGAQSPSHP